MCGKLFIAHFPPPLERGIVIIYYKYCIWVYLDFFIVRAVTLILMIWIRQSSLFCKWIRTQRLKMMFISCQPVLCVPSPWISELTFQCIYSFGSKMRNCLRFSFKWWLVIIEWCLWQELWGRGSVQISAFSKCHLSLPMIPFLVNTLSPAVCQAVPWNSSWSSAALINLCPPFSLSFLFPVLYMSIMFCDILTLQQRCCNQGYLS